MANNVNGVQIAGAATGAAGQIQAVGSDTNLGVRVVPKGTGGLQPNPMSVLAKSMGAGVHADVTLTAEEASAFVIKCGGTPDAGVNLVVGNVGCWMIVNGSGQTVTVKTAAGTGTAVATAKSALVVADGTNVVRGTADATT